MALRDLYRQACPVCDGEIVWETVSPATAVLHGFPAPVTVAHGQAAVDVWHCDRCGERGALYLPS